MLSATGKNLSLTNVIRGGGHTLPRTFRFPPGKDGKPVPVGWTLVSALQKAVEGKETIRVVPEAEVTEILTGSKMGLPMVRGVVYTAKDKNGELVTHSLDADAVILATGGFAANKTLLKMYAPDIADLPTTNGPWATGDGLEITKNFKVKTRDLDSVQVHPTGFLNPKSLGSTSVFLAPEALRACGGILIAPTTGKRFANELMPRDKLSAAIFTHGQPLSEWAKTHLESEDAMSQYPEVKSQSGKKQMTVAAMVLSEKAIEMFGEPSARFYEKVGVLKQYESIEEAADALKFPREALRQEYLNYAESKDGTADHLGKTFFPNAESYESTKNVWAGWITPTLHYCMGGISFSPKGELLAEDGHPIPGLYGAGEVVGGVHGRNRLVGNSLLECVVFGCISAESALSYVYGEGASSCASATTTTTTSSSTPGSTMKENKGENEVNMQHC